MPHPELIGFFADALVPVVAVDEHASISGCNAATRRLLGFGHDTGAGRRCFELMRLQDERGRSFCSARCPVTDALCQRHFFTFHRVAWTDPSRGMLLPLVLLSVPLGPPREGRRPPLFHLLAPRVDPVAVTTGRAHGTTSLHEPLSLREQDVLRLLADGHGTEAIAEALFISPVTVRNHVQHILAKLHVHRRLDAVMLWLGGRYAATWKEAAVD